MANLDSVVVFFFFLTLQYCISFAKYQNESATGIPTFPILNPPPSPILPLGRPSAPAPSIQYRASNLDWRLVSYMIYIGDSFHTRYTCFNAILPNLPTLSLSHRVQKIHLYISVSFAVSYTGLLLASF